MKRTLDHDITDLVDANALRREVQEKYREVAADPTGEYHFHTGRREVAADPTGEYHFHTGRAHAMRMGYPESPLDQLPNEATEAFAGVANPFYWGLPKRGERVVDLGSGAGMDSFIAALAVGPDGRVVGIDMTPEMIDLSSHMALLLGLQNVEFREGLIEDLPLESDWADVVISNGAINLCPDKLGIYKEIFRVLRPGGQMTIADICVEKPVPQSALKDIDLWTG